MPDPHPELRHVTRRADAFVSRITGRTVLVNLDRDRWYVPADLPADDFATAVRGARATYDAYVGGLVVHETRAASARRQFLRLHPRFRALADKALGATNPDALARAVEALVAAMHATQGDTAWRVPRFVEVLVHLWRHGLVAMPAWLIWPPEDGPLKGLRLDAPAAPLYGEAAALMREMEATAATGRKARLGFRPVAVKALLATVGVTEASDLDAAAVTALGDGIRAYLERTVVERADGATQRYGDLVYGFLNALLLTQKREAVAAPDRVGRLPAGYLDVIPRRAASRLDATYAWAREAGPRVEAWAAAVSAYVTTHAGKARLGRIVRDLNPLLDCVIAHEGWPATPLAACDIRAPLTPSVAEAVAATVRTGGKGGRATDLLEVHGRFFGWVIGTYERGLEHGERHPYANPVDASAVDDEQEARQGQTAREPIPLRYLHLIREIIEAPDERGVPYAWPRSLAEDYFAWLNPVTGVVESVWSPARAFFFLMRLMLPLRGFQVRMLDSGEGDAMEYRPGPDAHDGDAAWAPNPTPYRPAGPAGAVRDRRGFARRIFDGERGGHFTALYVNTNKTADSLHNWRRVGYEIPWHHREVLRLFAELRDFQGAYNPMTRPLRRDELGDRDLRLVGPDVARKLGETFFLFRDPCNRRYPTEPITQGRLNGFWLRLMAELERRLAEKDLTWGNGAAISLVGRNTAGKLSNVAFDQHSLRVTGITHLLHVAKLPINVVSAFVAGHATALMTYYYAKVSPGQIHERLEEAREVLAREDVAAREFAEYVRGKTLDVLREAVVYNHEDGLARLVAMDPAFLLGLDYGDCPAGGTMCDVGGPPAQDVTDNTKGVRHLPVLGGARNCVMCRFLVTGPPWLGGLVAKINETIGRLHDALRRQVELQRQYRAQRARHPDDLYDPGAWEDPALRRLEEAVQKVEADVALYSQMVERFDDLIVRTRAIMRARRDTATEPVAGATAPAGAALVLAGTADDFEVALRETTPYELWDRICRSAEIYPSVEGTMPAVRRARLHNALLRRNGLPDVFATLEPEECLAAGNEFSRWLHLRLTPADVNAAVEGRRTLAELGLLQDTAVAVAALASGPGARLLPSAAGARRGALRHVPTLLPASDGASA